MKLRTTLTGIALALGLMALSLPPSKIGSLFTSLATVSAAPSQGGSICGVATTYTPATATTAGSIRIAGLTYTIAPGVVLTGVAIGQDLCYRVCFNDQGQIAGGSSYSGYNVPLVCGIVTDFSRAIGGVAGSVTIGGAKIRIAPGLYLAGQDQVSPGSNSCLVPSPAGELAGVGSYFIPSPSPKQVRIPTTLRGRTFGPNSQEDIFNLPDPTILTFNSDQVFVFPAGPQTFGKTLFAESPRVEGFSYSTPNSTLQAVSCTESLWDIVMELASSGVTEGDMVTLNLLNANREVAQQLAMFTIQNGGALVNKLHPDVKLLANAQETKGAGYVAQFLIPAGNSGARTYPLALVLSTSSPAFMNCFQLAVEVKRGSQIGTTTVVIENVVVKRMERQGDRETSIGLGLQTNTIGWYPTGRLCDFVCTPCQKQGSWLSGYVYCDTDNDGVKDSGEAGIPNVEIRLLNSGSVVVDTTFTDNTGLYKFNIAQPGTYSVVEIQPTGSPINGDGKDTAGTCGGVAGNDIISSIPITTGVECADNNFGEQCGMPTVKCDTICWRATQYFITNIRHLPGGAVLISGVNANNPIGIQQGTDAIKIALQGGSGQMQKLNKEYVTAQLSLAYSGGSGSPVVFNTFWSALSCSGIAFAPVTLSNRVTLAPNSLLDTLVTQTNLAIKENRLNDMGALASIWALLNGRCG